MSIKKKVLSIAIIPVLGLGLITILLTLTMVKNSMVDEIQEALKGTAAATLSAYDQNAGDYLMSSNGVPCRRAAYLRFACRGEDRTEGAKRRGGILQ